MGPCARRNLAREQQEPHEERTGVLAAQRQMLGRADDLLSFGLVLDAVQAANQLEGLLRLGDVAGLEELSPCVGVAAAPLALSLLHERVVAAVVVAEEGAGGVAEHIDGYVAAAREVESVAGEAAADEGPHERLRGLLGHLEGGLVGVDEEVLLIASKSGARSGSSLRPARRKKSFMVLRATGMPRRAKDCSSL